MRHGFRNVTIHQKSHRGECNQKAAIRSQSIGQEGKCRIAASSAWVQVVARVEFSKSVSRLCDPPSRGFCSPQDDICLQRIGRLSTCLQRCSKRIAIPPFRRDYWKGCERGLGDGNRQACLDTSAPLRSTEWNISPHATRFVVGVLSLSFSKKVPL